MSALAGANMTGGRAVEISLPQPSKSSVSLDEALASRRSVREYTHEPVSFEAISRILWACQGVVGGGERRTAPSAGALYPLEIYLVAQRVDDVEPGLYKYKPKANTLTTIQQQELTARLAARALEQESVRNCAACIIITADVSRTAVKYGGRAERYVLMEVGHAAENVLLEAAALKLGAVPVGAFEEAGVKQLLEIQETPYYLIPVGVPVIK